MPKVSDAAAIKATGKPIKDWMEILDKEGAQKMEHKEIVKLLKDKGYIESSWWQQSITNQYEKHHGKREEGQMDTGFQIGVRATLPISPEAAWNLLTSKEAIQKWLGDTKDDIKKEGQSYETREGVVGRVNVYKPGSHVRMTWQLPSWDKHSVLQVRVLANGEKSVLSFHQEGLPKSKDREIMRKKWKEVLKQLGELAKERV